MEGEDTIDEMEDKWNSILGGKRDRGRTKEGDSVR